MRATTIRRILLALLTAAAFLVAVPSAPAAADHGCPGTRDSWRQYRDSAGTVAAALQVYTTADGVCVSLVSKNQYNGRRKFMSLKVCDSFREKCTAVDEGMFETFAGPIYYADHCTWAYSKMNDGNGGVIIGGHWSPAGSCN